MKIYTQIQIEREKKKKKIISMELLNHNEGHNAPIRGDIFKGANKTLDLCCHENFKSKN